MLLNDHDLNQINAWSCGSRVSITEQYVHQRFEHQAINTPQAIALDFAGQTLSYQKLNELANQLAHFLIKQGVGSEAVVALHMLRSNEMVISLLAILKAGGAYLPLDPEWPAQRLASMLEDTQACLMLSHTDFAESISGLPVKVFFFNELFIKLASCEIENPDCSRFSDRQLACIYYTSGSTGKPKGAMIEHRSILRLVSPSSDFGIGSTDVMLQLAPLTFDAATFEIWGALLSGAKLVIAPPDKTDFRALAQLLLRHKISILWLTAGLFHGMVDTELDALSGVRVILAGGETLLPTVVQRLLNRLPPEHLLINAYGPTEATTFSCWYKMTSASTVDPAGVPIGRPVAGTYVRILDEHGQYCPVGTPGELYIGGIGLARGYLNQQALSKTCFIPDTFHEDSAARLYKSGDLAAWKPDGTIFFHGRYDHKVKISGIRIEPGEIEAELSRHPDIAQAMVVCREQMPGHKQLIAFWIAAANAKPSSDNIRAFLAKTLPEAMIPRVFIPVDRFVLTPNGKVDRKAMLLLERCEPEAIQKPLTPLENELLIIWREVLGREDFGIEGNFFELGGNSIDAALLTAKINTRLNSQLAISILFDRPDIRSLANLLASAKHELLNKRNANIVHLKPTGHKIPVFFVHGWGGWVGNYFPLVQALETDRPAWGIQVEAINGKYGVLEHEVSVSEMAKHYAAQLLDFYPKGPYHLIGFSAGGWYAHAIARELLKAGAKIGIFVSIDTQATADVDSSMNDISQANKYRDHSDYYIAIHAAYQPEPLALHAYVFSSKDRFEQIERIWNFYARNGITPYHFNCAHLDFLEHPETIKELVCRINQALLQVENS